MTLDDLGFGFILWICSLFPTILIFFAELFGWIWKNETKKEFQKIKYAKVHSEVSIMKMRREIELGEDDSSGYQEAVCKKYQPKRRLNGSLKFQVFKVKCRKMNEPIVSLI